MSSPIPRRTPRKGSNPKNVVWDTRPPKNGKGGQKVFAPRGGTVRRFKRKGKWRGVVITTKGGAKHYLHHVKARKGLLGKTVVDGKWIGTATGTKVAYKRLSPKEKDGKRVHWAAMPVVRRPVTKTHRKPWIGSHPVPVGWKYSSGTDHRAWDVGMWTGTKLFASADMYIAACNDGVANNRPGYNPGSGANSNWILGWCRDKKGNKVTLYFQHLSPGIKVRKGQKVKVGAFIALSGNTGNSSGPHLHLHAMKGWQWERYRIYSDVSVAIYGPNKTWE